MSYKFENLSILVIDDTLPMRKIIAAVLQTLGIGKIYQASDGNEGFRMFVKQNPDIVITDWHMPNANGLDLVNMIRNSAISPNRTVPIIMITGYNAHQRVSTARDKGITEFLVKPFTADQIAKRIAYVINKPRDFVKNYQYFGPDRRRTSLSYAGPDRRLRSNRNQNDQKVNL